jgi:hypothetical protein
MYLFPPVVFISHKQKKGMCWRRKKWALRYERQNKFIKN